MKVNAIDYLKKPPGGQTEERIELSQIITCGRPEHLASWLRIDSIELGQSMVGVMLCYTDGTRAFHWHVIMACDTTISPHLSVIVKTESSVKV